MLLRRAFDTAAAHDGLTLQALADELAWTPATVSHLLGVTNDDRPHLQLV